MSDIESLKQESRIFLPPVAFAAQAAVPGMSACEARCAEAERDYEGFWASLARENPVWQKPFIKVWNEAAKAETITQDIPALENPAILQQLRDRH